MPGGPPAGMRTSHIPVLVSLGSRQGNNSPTTQNTQKTQTSSQGKEGLQGSLYLTDQKVLF